MISLISQTTLIYIGGTVALVLAILGWRDTSNPKRLTTGLFWFVFSIPFLLGNTMVSVLGASSAHRIVGFLVLGLAVIAGMGGLGAGKHVAQKSFRVVTRIDLIRNKIFLPMLLVPVTTVSLTLFAKDWSLFGLPLLDAKNLTISALVAGAILAFIYACVLTRDTPLQAIRESRKLTDAMGWALILPQMLAMLGGVFVASKTGQAIQDVVTQFVTPDSRFGLVALYCIGMALFTMVMGNAFAAFPVLAAGVGLPFLILEHHGNAAVIAAVGMYSGYCGTLMTPMAANFNIVPAALLELKDKYQVIKIQIPTGLAVLACNILILYFLAF